MIPDRTDIAYYAQKLFYKTGKAVEVGVWKGEFAKENLRLWLGEYVLVDTWALRMDDHLKGLNDKNHEDWEFVMEQVKKNTERYSDRVVVRKGYSVDVAKTYPNGYFDWIYLDAGHDYENFKKDLEAWWPKLRDGGLMSGDDYGIGEGQIDTLSADRWAEKYSGVAKTYKWDTARVLKEKGLEVSVTWMNDRYKTPAWYVKK